jgi:hypothetical protein
MSQKEEKNKSFGASFLQSLPYLTSPPPHTHSGTKFFFVPLTRFFYLGWHFIWSKLYVLNSFESFFKQITNKNSNFNFLTKIQNMCQF